jgi:hypothetical protein
MVQKATFYYRRGGDVNVDHSININDPRKEDDSMQ